MRSIPNIGVDRARLRTTLVYRFTDSIQAGVEYNTIADDVGLLANWRAIEETQARPALILGTSSDRIGTTHGRSYYGTLSKDLEHLTRLPVAPYAGLAFGEQDDEWLGIGGLVVRWGEHWTTTSLFDGRNLHHVLETTIAGRHRVGLVLARQGDESFLGLSYSFSFALPFLERWRGD